MKQFLDSQWETEDVKEAVTALRKLALEDQEKSVEGVVAIPGEVRTLVNSAREFRFDVFNMTKMCSKIVKSLKICNFFHNINSW